MFLEGIEEYMFTCTLKKTFGLECFGCGAQRATLLFFKGEFVAAFKMYPAIYFIFSTVSFAILNLFIKFKNDYKIKMGMVYFTVAVVIISYFYKMGKFM